MKIILKNHLTFLSIISVVFNLNAMQPKMTAEQATKEAQIKASQAQAKRSLKITTAQSIIMQLRAGQLSAQELKKLPQDLQEYITDLMDLLDHYKILMGNENINENPTAALRFAINFGSVELVEDLIAIGANVNDAPGDRPAPLMLATTNVPNSEAIVRLLIAHGADMNLQSYAKFAFAKENTPLHSAIIHKNITALIALIQNGALIDIANKAGDTPLHAAANFFVIGDNEFEKKEIADMIEILIENGAKKIINKQNNLGWTALMIATTNTNLPAVKLLLENGADPTLANTNGRTALDMARSALEFSFDKPETKQAIVKLLEEYQAQQQKK